MKSAHRHQLETNALAQRLDVLLERLRPYAATVAGVLVAVVVIMFIWSYVRGTTAARQTEAWDAFHRALVGRAPNLEQLRQTAQEYPGTEVQQLADVTWADGQVYMAAEQILYNRDAAMAALERAASAYQGVLQRSGDERIVNRARLGLARIYEMRNELERAREEYLKVGGAYAEYAKLQAERLEKPEAKEDYAWLATAQATVPRAPQGPGSPGQRPEFSPQDIPLPGGGTNGAPADGAAEGDAFEELLRSLELSAPANDGPSRYDGEAPPATPETPAEGGSP